MRDFKLEIRGDHIAIQIPLKAKQIQELETMFKCSSWFRDSMTEQVEDTMCDVVDLVEDFAKTRTRATHAAELLDLAFDACNRVDSSFAIEEDSSFPEEDLTLEAFQAKIEAFIQCHAATPKAGVGAQAFRTAAQCALNLDVRMTKKNVKAALEAWGVSENVTWVEMSPDFVLDVEAR